MMRFSIVIPAHNEAARIGGTVRDFSGAFEDSEIVVVLNGCTDSTPQIVRELASRHPNVAIVEIEDPIGKGGAVRAGMLVAQAPVVAYVDADRATSAAEMRRLCEALDGYDAVVASRWCRGAVVEIAQPLQRRFASRVFNAIVRLLFGLKVSDTQCGAKAFRADALLNVLPAVETSNFAFDVDLLFAMKNAGMRIIELPTVWRDAAGSRVRLVPASLRMLASILRLRIRHSFFRAIVPAFDYFIPTAPMRSHHGFNVLLLNWRDPRHPQAGGAEAYLHEMARRWVAQGHTVEWLTAGFGGAPREETIDGIRVTRAGNALSVYARLPLAYLRRFRDRFDVIVDAENGIPFFSPLFSMKPKICVVHHVHQQVLKNHMRWPVSAMLAWAERWLMPRLYGNGAFVAVSEDTRQAMHDELGIPRHAIEVIHNGVDDRLGPGTKSAHPSVLYLGRLKKYKRVDRIVEAFARVRALVPDAALHIAGDGDDRARLERCAAAAKIADAVVFEGFVSFERKRELLQSAWVAANASEIEGWGVGVIEAAACATPTVAFSVPGLREAILPGVTGLLVPEGEDLAPAIARVLTDETLRARLSSAAIDRAKEFSWDASAAAMLDVIARATIGRHYGFVRKRDGWVFHSADVARVKLETRP
jgi:glycosyltransferase involved in cell wall biosynthesis